MEPSAGPRAGGVQPSQLLHALLGAPVVAFECRARLPAEDLHPLELAHVCGAAATRVGDFAAGRACARSALATLGVRDFALRVGADREPLWPAGITGSITHTEGFCGVAAAHASQMLSLGIDAEAHDAVEPRLWGHICTAQEQAWLGQLEPEQARRCGALIFSAKESFYKCQYPLTRQWVNFADVSVSIRGDGFEILPQRQLRLSQLRPGPWPGRYALQDGLVVTALRLA